MVSRVDRKPVIYGAGFTRFIKPVLETNNKSLLARILEKTKGYALGHVDAYQLTNAFEEIDDRNYWAGMNIDYGSWSAGWVDEEEEELIRVARACYMEYASPRSAMRAMAMSEVTAKCYARLIPDIEEIYFGPEGTYVLMNQIINDKVFDTSVRSGGWEWIKTSTTNILNLQGPYCFLHASATASMGTLGAESFTPTARYSWDLYKKAETLGLRLSSRKSVLAHAHHMGTLRKHFEESEDTISDFELPLTGFVKATEHAQAWVLNGMRLVRVGRTLIILTHDDCVSLSLLAQCWFRNVLYFSVWNGYKENTCMRAQGVAKDMYDQIDRRIRSGKNFAEFIRSMHICAQKEFNDSYEAERGDDLGWEARSENYIKEADALDRAGRIMYEKCVSLACSKIDRLNVGLMYHMLVGDDMQISDLVEKVSVMPTKVLDADKNEWSKFIKFCRSYILCRYLFTFRKRPSLGGDLEQANNRWFSRCLSGSFSMPKPEDHGKIWIAGEFPWSTHADTWHLDAQDVAYVMKDLDGMKKGKYRKDRKHASELLMAMEHGEILDPLTGSIASSARDRICSGPATHVAVLTTAPKAENAKPSWKKRVTFAADNEFRKMQAEYDRNARRSMSFIRGPSLGIDQCVLETQFKDIATHTGATTCGCICSHDISAWSESMDRDRKFEFEKVLIDMTTKPEMIGIKKDWDKIHAVVNKMGAEEEFKLDQGSFQGFDGSASTILHSMILLYCMETARQKLIISTEVKTNLATLIDDCVALMDKLTDRSQANNFWAHLKATYRRLGFEVDELKSIFSTIKAIYLSRRFLLGGEVPADYKIFIKAHVSYEDPLRSVTDVPKDIFGALRGACDANGQAWFIYYCACATSLAEMVHQCPEISKLHPGAVAVISIAPPDEMGWGFPSIVDWCTNDVVDKRVHFNAIMELAAEFDLQSEDFRAGCTAFTNDGLRMFSSIKMQPWRLVSYSGLFCNPYEAVRDGPMKPDMLKRSAVADILKEITHAEPWKSLLSWNTSDTTNLLRELLVRSGPLSAPILGALVNCMPDNYRLGMIGKAVGSNSILDLLPRGTKVTLKRRVHRVGSAFILHALSIYSAERAITTPGDVAVLSYTDRSRIEREGFYALNNINMIDHTFPDPVATFTRVSESVGSRIRPCGENLRMWDHTVKYNCKVSERLSNHGMYVPRKSQRVWEVATEYGKGWDTVSQKIALGMAVLARAKADGHGVDGLLVYFIRSWNEASNISMNDMSLIAIQGSIKRLDSNPGSSTHPVTAHRNLSTAFLVDIKTAINAIAPVCKEKSGETSHLHDIHSHYTAMRCVTTLIYESLADLGYGNRTLEYMVGLRRDSVIPSSKDLMKTGNVANRMMLEIMDAAEPYGLVQACPQLASVIIPPTMQVSWVSMINALTEGDYSTANNIIKATRDKPLDELISDMEGQFATYSVNVSLAATPIIRHSVTLDRRAIFAVMPEKPGMSETGDIYTRSIGRVSNKPNRAFAESIPSDILCSSVIKSCVWQKLKDENMGILSDIVYGDLDVDPSFLRVVNTKEFWGSVVSSCSKQGLRGNMSEVIMKAFYKLGIRGIHIKASTDNAHVVQAITSYFGASLREIAAICSDEICKIAGRNKRDYERPATEITITHQPSVKNSALRKAHMQKLIKFNVSQLKKRLWEIDHECIRHTGDQRACTNRTADGQYKVCRELTKPRRVFLQVRKAVYKSAKVYENGQLEVSAGDLAARIRKSAYATVIRKTEPDDPEDEQKATYRSNLSVIFEAPYSKESVWKYTEYDENDVDMDMIVPYMEYLQDIVVAVDGYWNPQEGDAGMRYALLQLKEDSDMVKETKFAISASEIAPTVYRRVMCSSSISRDTMPPSISEWEAEFDPFAGEEGVDMFSEDFMSKAYSFDSKHKLDIPLWQALAAVIYTGKFDADEVNAHLGTNIPAFPSAAQIKKSDLSKLSDEAIEAAFPNISSEYIMCGTMFSYDWFDDEENEGYTVDEVGKAPGGGML